MLLSAIAAVLMVASMSFADGVARGAAPTREAEPPVDEEVPEPGPSPSMSVGRTNRGRLVDGVELVESDTLRIKKNGPARFGTQELVDLLRDSADAVAARHPGSVLLVGDLSREDGGRFRPHRSHRSGRDVDVSFYLKDDEGVPAVPARFVRMRWRGDGRQAGKKYAFDAERNWAFVEAMIHHRTEVQFVFVAGYLRRMILEEAERQNADPDVIERAAAILHQPQRGAPHRSHFHIRVYCAADDLPRCRDQAPIWDWVERPATDEASSGE